MEIIASLILVVALLGGGLARQSARQDHERAMARLGMCEARGPAKRPTWVPCEVDCSSVRSEEAEWPRESKSKGK